MKYEEDTEAFKHILEPDNKLNSDVIKILEKFTILMYCCESDGDNINQARKDIFCSGRRTVNTIPPTSASLVKHIKGANYQLGQIWGYTAGSIGPISVPSPVQWGWEEGTIAGNQDGTIWLQYRLPCEISKIVPARVLVKASCSCHRFHLPCTPACRSCKGECCNKK